MAYMELATDLFFTFIIEDNIVNNINNYIMHDQVQNQISAIMASDSAYSRARHERFSLLLSICSLSFIYLLF